MPSTSKARAARGGFLLLELLLAVALSALVAGLLLTLLTQLRTTHATSAAMDTLTAEAELILDALNRRLTEAIPGSLHLEGEHGLGWLVRAGGGRYRRAARADGSGRSFDPEALSGSFDLIGGLRHRPGTLSTLQARTGSDLAGCGQGALCLLFDADAEQPSASAAVTAIDTTGLDYRRSSSGEPGNGSTRIWLYTDGEALRCALTEGRLSLLQHAGGEQSLSRHLVDCRLRLYPLTASGERLVGIELRLALGGHTLALHTQFAVRGLP